MQDQQYSNHPDPLAREIFNKRYEERAKREAERPKIEKEGEAALRRLFEVAQRDSGQSRVVAKFLLGCYNGDRFPFDLTDFRALDYDLFDDCLSVLKMDVRPKREVHTYFTSGSQLFEKMAKDWGFQDHRLMRLRIEKQDDRSPY